jgi:hypothetical protein
MWLGSHAVDGSKILIEHPDNSVTRGNFIGDKAQLKLFGDPVFTLQLACDRKIMSMACVDMEHASINSATRLQMLQGTFGCSSLNVVAVIGMHADEVNNADWSVVASGVDYVSKSPLLNVFCWFRMPGCQRVHWLLAMRKREGVKEEDDDDDEIVNEKK